VYPTMLACEHKGVSLQALNIVVGMYLQPFGGIYNICIYNIITLYNMERVYNISIYNIITLYNMERVYNIGIYSIDTYNHRKCL